jgi:tripartite-type tricarboxylate transporter receptor subunit TctC
VGPKGLPAEVVSKIHADVQKVLADPDIKSRYNTFAFEALSWTAEEIRKQAEIKNKTYGKLVERKNISLE